MRLYYFIVPACVMLLLPFTGICQEAPANNLYNKFLNTLSQKMRKLDEALDKKSEAALQKLYKEEKRLKAKVAKKNKKLADEVFKDLDSNYTHLQKNISNTGSYARPSLEYDAYMDTLATTLRFFNDQKLPLPGELSKVTGQLKGLEQKLTNAGDLQKYLKARREVLRQQLSELGFAKELKKINKEIYYYSQAVNDYKQMFKDPARIESKILALLKESSLFKKFFKEHSIFSSLFPDPGSYTASSLNLEGLQTRQVVQNFINNNAAIGSATPQQFVGQQVQSAQASLSELKQELSLPVSSAQAGADDFKPNQQKTKPFLKRLELGGNVQFGKPNNFLPTTSDFAFTIGYKLNDNGSVGIGTAYKLGLGSGINNIRFSHQGIGMRSYIDWRLKKNFYVTGGYELNHFSSFESISQLRNFSAWQTSGLVGITKKIPATKRAKPKLQLLIDLLSFQNTPRTQPILFRVGWDFSK